MNINYSIGLIVKLCSSRYVFRKAVSNEDDEYKASQQTYYNIAHSSKEVIVEQPAILVGGQLKAYQVIDVIVIK